MRRLKIFHCFVVFFSTLKEILLFSSVTVAVKTTRLRSLFRHLELILTLVLYKTVLASLAYWNTFIVFIFSSSCCQSKLKKSYQTGFIPSYSTEETNSAFCTSSPFLHFHQQPWRPANCRLKGNLLPSSSSEKITTISQLSVNYCRTVASASIFRMHSSKERKFPQITQFCSDGCHPFASLPGNCRGRVMNSKWQLFHWSAKVSNSIHDFLIAKHSLRQQKYLFNGNQIWVINLKPIKLYAS